jgi:DNA-binding transcriptional regulator YhcF (GntR family)
MGRKSGKPKYEQVKEWLKKKINSGDWTAGRKLPPQVELFKRLKARDSTVGHALNDLVQEGVIVRRQGDGTYVADAETPPIIKGRHLRIGVLWFHSVVQESFKTSFTADLTRGILKAWGLYRTEPVFSQNDQDKTTEAVWHQPNQGITVECVGEAWGGRNRVPPLKAVREREYDGLITLGIIEEPYLDKTLNLGLPTVIVDFPTQKFGHRSDLVFADPQLGYREAIEFFIEKGLNQIHFVGARIWDPYGKPEKGMTSAKRIDPDTFLRLSAYRQAMDACGLEVPASWIHFVASDTEKRESLVKSLVSKAPEKRPQAVICHGSELAELIIEKFGEHGLPQQQTFLWGV